MSIQRRDFLKAALGGSLAAAAGAQPGLAAAKKHAMPPEALGILYDSNLCIGCQACMTACKQANDMPVEFSGQQRIWDNPLDLSAKTLNIIKMYEGEETTAFVKRQCLHCLEPGCASACPVSALEKDPTTGIVTYDKKACIGCRYCQVACPYNVPKFEWDNPFPQIRKCELCHHLLAEDRYAACCESCPTGASLFGPVKDLRQEAERRLNMKPGRYYDFPVNHISTGKTQTHKAEAYVPTIYGADELGGTQVMLLSGVEFSTLGLPEVRAKSYVSDLESLSSKLYSYMLLPAAVFGGLLYVAKKNSDHE